MMNVLFLVVLCGGLSYAASETIFEPLMDHVMVLKVPDNVRTEVNVPLVCEKDNQIQDVFWKKDGMELKPALRGNSVSVLVQEMDGGNFSCHHSSTGEYLNHTLIYIQLDSSKRVILKEQSLEEGHIHCSAPNYTGPFRCSWTRTPYRSNAAVLLLEATQNSQKMPCELDADGAGVQCHQESCPYKEEQHRVQLKVHVHSHSRLETYTKAFYLREIVTPGALANLRKSEENAFSWSYPETWEKPCSYYSLNFQVRVVRGGLPCDSEAPILVSDTGDTRFEVGVKTKKYVFCVRAQDRYTRGPFGPWSRCVVNKEEVDCQSPSSARK